MNNTIFTPMLGSYWKTKSGFRHTIQVVENKHDAVITYKYIKFNNNSFKLTLSDFLVVFEPHSDCWDEPPIDGMDDF